jgi:hypothetical protein
VQWESVLMRSVQKSLLLGDVRRDVKYSVTGNVAQTVLNIICVPCSLISRNTI